MSERDYQRGPDAVRHVYRSTGSETVFNTRRDDPMVWEAVAFVHGHRISRSSDAKDHAVDECRAAIAEALRDPSVLADARWREPRLGGEEW